MQKVKSLKDLSSMEVCDICFANPQNFEKNAASELERRNLLYQNTNDDVCSVRERILRRSFEKLSQKSPISEFASVVYINTYVEICKQKPWLKHQDIRKEVMDELDLEEDKNNKNILEKPISNISPEVEKVFEKLFKAFAPTKEELERKELIRQNAHPLLFRALTERDEIIKEAIMKKIEKDNDEAKDTFIEKLMEIESTLLVDIVKEVLRVFKEPKKGIDFAVLHMNKTKEKLEEIIRTVLFKAMIPDSKEKGDQIVDIINYTLSLETYQTAFILQALAETSTAIHKSYINEQLMQNLLTSNKPKDEIVKSTNSQPIATDYRRKMRRGKTSLLDKHIDEIKDLILNKGVSMASAHKIINPKLEKKITYTSFFHFVKSRGIK